MSGACGMNPEFMAFNCRESCGACGFKSGNLSLVYQPNPQFKQKWSVLTCIFYYNFLANLASTPQRNKDDKEQYSYIEGFGKIEDGNHQKFCKYHQYNSIHQNLILCI